MTWYDTKDKVPEKRGDSIVYLNNKKQVKQLIFDWDEAFVRDDEEEMKQFCEKNSFLRCFKTSAKTGTNIDESMNFLISTIIDKMESLAQTGTNPFEKNRESMVLQSKKHNENSKENTSNGCC